MKNLNKVIAILISIMVSNTMFSQILNEEIQKSYYNVNIQKVIEVGNERYYLSKAGSNGGVFNNTKILEKDSLYNFSIFKIVNGVTVWNINILKVQKTTKYYQNCNLVDFSYDNGKLNLMYMVDTIQDYVMENWVLIDSTKIITKASERCVKNMVINPLNGNIISINKANNKFLPYDYGYGYGRWSQLQLNRYKNSLYVQTTTLESTPRHIITKYRIGQNHKIDSIGSVIVDGLSFRNSYNISIYINDSDIYLSDLNTIKFDTNLNIKNFNTDLYSKTPAHAPKPVFLKSNKIYFYGSGGVGRFLTLMNGNTGLVDTTIQIDVSNPGLEIEKFLASSNDSLDFVGYDNNGRYLIRIGDDLSNMRIIKYDNIETDGASVLSDNIRYADGSITFYQQKDYSFHRITIGNQAVLGVDDENITHNSNIYPNPAKDKITVVANGSELLSIYNATGNLVHQQTIHGTQEIDINDLTSGLYLYNLGAKRGKLVIK